MKANETVSPAGEKPTRSTMSATDGAAPNAMVDNLVKVDPAEEGEEGEEQPEEPEKAWKKTVVRCLDDKYSQIVFSVSLIFVLFAVDVVAITSLPNSVDNEVDALLLVFLVLYTVELILNSIAREGYFLSFFFFMDFVGTVSIVADISFLSDKLLPGTNQGTTLRASRAARVGSRTGRMTRVLKVIRFVKLAMAYYFKPQDKKLAQNLASSGQAPSAIGQTLSEAISHQVAGLVMVTVLVTPLLEYPEVDGGPQAFANMLYMQYNLTNGPSEGLNATVQEFRDYYDGTFTEPTEVIVGDMHWDWRSEVGGYTKRKQDKVEVRPNIGGDIGRETVSTYFNVVRKNHEVAMFNILFVNFVIFELILFSSLLNAKTTALVVRPLERIFTVIQNNASHLMGQLDVDLANSEMGSMEKAIGKMTMLMSHVGKLGGKASSKGMVQNFIKDRNVDQSTKAWLMEMEYGEAYENQDDNEAADAEAQKNKNHRQSTLMSGQGGEVDSSASGETVQKKEHSVSLFYSAEEFKEYMRILSEKGESVDDLRNITPATVEGWDFDVFLYKPHQLYLCFYFMFDGLGLFDAGLVPADTFWQFVVEVEQSYRDNPYHNFEHACDVTQTVYNFIKLVDPRVQFSLTEKMAMIIGAVCHDIDHPGVSNAFLINTRDELALVYNDSSILENHHAACLYSMLKENPNTDVFKNIAEEKLWKELRRIVITIILNTDMSHHFQMVSQVELFLELNQNKMDKGEFIFAKQEDRQFIMNLIMHSADISNPVKPFAVYNKWADRVLSEFFQQGDMEKERKMPCSPMMDRNTTSRAMSQINFIEFVVAPLYATIIRLFPELKQLAINLIDNRQRFGEMYDAEEDAQENKALAQREEEKTMVHNRYDRFIEKYGFQHLREEEDQDGEGTSHRVLVVNDEDKDGLFIRRSTADAKSRKSKIPSESRV